jgi:hypothetical protein
MANVPAVAKAFAHRWRIAQIDLAGDARDQLGLHMPTRLPSSTAC